MHELLFLAGTDSVARGYGIYQGHCHYDSSERKALFQAGFILSPSSFVSQTRPFANQRRQTRGKGMRLSLILRLDIKLFFQSCFRVFLVYLAFWLPLQHESMGCQMRQKATYTLSAVFFSGYISLYTYSVRHMHIAQSIQIQHTPYGYG